MAELVIEDWTSSQGQAERHFFLSKDGAREVYFFGINPQLFDDGQIETLRALLLLLLDE